MGSEQEIQKLAETLRKTGMASSDYDARQRAERIITGKNKGQDVAVEMSAAKKIDEIKKEVEEEAREIKKGREGQLFTEIKAAKADKKKNYEESSIDLTKIFNVNK